ncbi:MAG: hypothetical protein A3H97_00835 [Acidobacteria bacterium RIFCSPLOWO2_02_FULL_65_29]|nr:MAG: hypothetical protein A3H97_00835 [Acidobacteria bacterium RIFCSPLOWO2_02_FULL_65_29]
MPGQDSAPVCVLCRRRLAEDPWQPFCSERCRLQDLARWVDGAYRVAGEAVDEPDPSEADASEDAE